MSSLDNYRKRVNLGTNNRREKLILQAERTFERQLEESPSSLRLKYTKPMQVDIVDTEFDDDFILQDISDNDKKAFDEKWILVRNSNEFDIGCYIWFDGTWWLALHKEHRVLDTHKKFTLKKCNNMFNYVVDGVLHKIPSYIENLSLYSDGLADLKYTSQEDGKASVYFGKNPITDTIIVNTRLMVENRLTFRLTNINNFEYRSAIDKPGAIKCMMLQTTILDEDDLKNNIAFNDISKSESVDTSVLKIVGKDKVYVGSKVSYDSSSNVEFRHWELHSTNAELKSKVIVNTPGGGDKYCELTFPKDMKFIGEKVILKLFVSNVLRDSLEITLSGL